MTLKVPGHDTGQDTLHWRFTDKRDGLCGRKTVDFLLPSIPPQVESARKEADEARRCLSLADDRAEAAERRLRSDLNAQHGAALDHVMRQVSSLQQQLEHKDSAREQLLVDKGALEKALEAAHERHKELEGVVSAERLRVKEARRLKSLLNRSDDTIYAFMLLLAF